MLGIDPDPARLWRTAGRAEQARPALAAALAAADEAARAAVGGDTPPSRAGATPRFQAAAAVLAHCLALIDAAGPACVAIKPQLACFEVP